MTTTRTLTEPELYSMALDTWGLDAQVAMLAEESVELAHATLKVIRKGLGAFRQGRPDPADVLHGLESLADEMADVEIMIAQIKQAIPGLTAQVLIQKSAKLDRLARRLLDGKQWWKGQHP